MRIGGDARACQCRVAAAAGGIHAAQRDASAQQALSPRWMAEWAGCLGSSCARRWRQRCWCRRLLAKALGKLREAALAKACRQLILVALDSCQRPRHKACGQLHLASWRLRGMQVRCGLRLAAPRRRAGGWLMSRLGQKGLSRSRRRELPGTAAGAGLWRFAADGAHHWRRSCAGHV